MAKDKSWLDDSPIIRPAHSVSIQQTSDEMVDVAGEGTMAVPKSQTGPPPITSLEDARDLIQRGDMAALQYLKPAPDENAITSAAKKAAMVGVHGGASLLQMPINALLGLTQGPRIENGQINVPALRMNPETGAPQLTPEAQTTVGVAATPLRFGPRGPVPSPGTFNRDTTVTGINSVDPAVVARAEGRTAFRGAQGEPPAATSQTGEFIPPTSRTPAVAAPATAAAGTPEEIMANAKAVADQHYGIAEKAGLDSGFTPASVNKMVDVVDSVAPQGPGERAVAGQNEVTRLQRDMQALRDKPLTLSDIQLMDEKMSGLITSELRAGREKVANQLRDIQDKWRDQVDNATAADVAGGTRGFQALDPARQAWSQYRKMQDVMLMQERASMTQNPTTSYKTAVKNFTTSRASRSWSEEEKASLIQSADRGVIGGTLHLLGSRLLPHVGGAVGAGVGGIPGFLAGEVVTHGIGGVARTAANTMQEGRVNRMMGVLANRVPPRPNDLLGQGP